MVRRQPFFSKYQSPMSTDSNPPEENPQAQTSDDNPVSVEDETSPASEESTADQEPSPPTTTPARKISIGSQRDVAGPVTKPKAVQEAIANPLEMDKKDDATKPVAEIKSTDGLSDDLDAEIEAMMSSFSMDSVVENTQAAETQLEPKTRLKATVARIHGENIFFSLPGQYEGIASVTHFKTLPTEGDQLDVIVRDLNKEDGLYELSIPGSAVNVADWDDINEGDVVDATVTGSNSGGLEAAVNKLKGFIPASQIDRFRVENFEDYVGKKLQCVVMEVNPEKRKLVISHRGVIERENEAKRKELLETLEEGQLLDGTVTKLMDFGAFVDIGGMEGLIHISKLAWNRLKHPSEAVDVGQKVKVKVEKFDKQTGKISLSHRDTLEHPWEGIEQKYHPDDIVTGTVAVASSPPVAMAAGGGSTTPVVDQSAMSAMLDEESEPDSGATHSESRGRTTRSR